MPLTAVLTVTPAPGDAHGVRSRKQLRRTSPHRRFGTVAVALSGLALTAACTGPTGAVSGDDPSPSSSLSTSPAPSTPPRAEPSATPSAQPDVTPAAEPDGPPAAEPNATVGPRPTAAPTQTAAPKRTAAPTATPSPPEPAGPTFHAGGRVGDLPAHAPEADAVRYLSERLGFGPHVDSDVACENSGLPGRTLEWQDTGVELRVRTTDDTGAGVPAYAAAWILTERSTAWGLGTDTGLQVGDTGGRVLELYPDVVHGEWLDPGSWWYVITEDGETITVVSSDLETGAQTVDRIESGHGCGE